jgi:hypothetical protein
MEKPANVTLVAKPEALASPPGRADVPAPIRDDWKGDDDPS